MTRIGCCVALTMMALVTVGGSAASAQDTGWNVRFNVTYTDPARNFADDGSGSVRVSTDTSEAFGLALSSEYRISDRLGLEVGVQAGYEADIRLNLQDASGANLRDPFATDPSDGLRFTIVDAALNIYLASGSVDFYIAPVIGYVFYDDLEFLVGRPPGVATRVAVDDDVAFGGVVGLDIPCGEGGWFFTSTLKYLEASYDAQLREGRSSEEVDFDPLIVRAGFGYRF